jgi:glutamate racemase
MGRKFTIMKIAAFDSGVGGLTALAPLLKNYSGLEITYYGDLANLPYGTKSPQRIQELTRRNLEWLLGEERFDLGVIACHTASAHAIAIGEELGRSHQVPVVGVLEPGCQAALRSQAKRIVVIATSSTVRSGAYLKKLQELGCAVPVVQQACPLFVPLVEENLHQSPPAEWAVRHYLEAVLKPGDAVVLGCTHYPFLTPMLSRVFPSHLWIDAGGSLIEDPTVKNALSSRSAKSARNVVHLKFSDHTVTRERVEQMLAELGMSDLQISFEIVEALM